MLTAEVLDAREPADNTAASGSGRAFVVPARTTGSRDSMHVLPTSHRAGASRLFTLVAAGAMIVVRPAARPPRRLRPPPTTGASRPPRPSASRAAPTPGPTQAGPVVLKVAATANITTWDPVKSFSTEALYMANLYEPLLWINPPGSAEQFTPALAESWDASADGKTWTFHLRDGVTFHDGEAITADAVKQSIEAAAAKGGASFIWAALDTVTAADDRDRRAEAQVRRADGPRRLVALRRLDRQPQGPAASAADDKYFEKGIDAGTGPYTIESYTADNEVLMTEYDDYWGGWDGVKHYDKVLVSITPEAAVQQQMLDGGEVDIALSCRRRTSRTTRTTPTTRSSTSPRSSTTSASSTPTSKPLDDPKVRQALSYAIPYDDIIAVGAQGYGTQSHGPVPAGVFPYAADVPQYHQDIEKAKSLLTEAGHEAAASRST